MLGSSRHLSCAAGVSAALGPDLLTGALTKWGALASPAPPAAGKFGMAVEHSWLAGYDSEPANLPAGMGYHWIGVKQKLISAN